MTKPLPKLEDFFRENNLATATDAELSAEQQRRQLMRNFPLHVFHPKIKPFINALHKEYDLPRSYIGLSMLSAYSSAVGSAYHIKQNKLGTMYFPVWACLEGISSAGKSLVMNQVFKPLYQIQAELEEEWFTAIEGKSLGEVAAMKSKQLIYGDAHLPTLIKQVIPANPKGILQDADEILAWINGMNQLAKGGKEGTDEQFWMKSWDCKEHRKILANNQIYVIKKPYLNVFGGAQPSIIHKLFKNDRDTTGFIYRLLFAVPETHKIAEPNLAYDMPEEYERMHNKCLNSLYRGLYVDEDSESRSMILDTRALTQYNKWAAKKSTEVTGNKDLLMKEKLSGIYGKMKAYCLRFAGLLHLADKAYDGARFEFEEIINEDTMARAVELADYFFDAAQNITERVNKAVIASPDVIRIASYMKAGFSFQKIGDLEFSDIKSEDARRARASRLVKKLVQEYPKIFGAEVK
jgi:hypothetical protein